ncbi:transmembrane protein 65, partial [Silurus meridionalis]
LAGYVEALACRLGMQIPDLSPKQADMWQTRVSSHMGKAIGVGIGCILGMFPLLFYKDDEDKKKGTAEDPPPSPPDSAPKNA